MEVFFKKQPLLNIMNQAVLVVIFFGLTTTVASAVAEVPAGAPTAPVIESASFPDPEEWYQIKDGQFSWELPEDVTAVAIELATSSDHEPQTVFKPAIDTFTINAEELSGGLQYLQVQFKNESGWGEIASRQIGIDVTAPESIFLKVEQPKDENGFPVVLFAAKDTASGIDRYELQLIDHEPVVFDADEAKFGYLVRDLEDGLYSITLTAFDKAGNSVALTGLVEVHAGWVDPSKPVEIGLADIELSFAHWLIIFLSMLSVGQAVHILSAHRTQKAEERRLLHETMEVRRQMEKIFTALRDEIYEQVNAINKRSRLSKREKETVENLNQALMVSETLIEKELRDVQKVIK